eukprot:1176974-Ditylum_brightwellii.AAC.1
MIPHSVDGDRGDRQFSAGNLKGRYSSNNNLNHSKHSRKLKEQEQDFPFLEYHQHSSGILSCQHYGVSLGVDTALTGYTTYNTLVEVKTMPQYQQIKESF